MAHKSELLRKLIDLNREKVDKYYEDKIFDQTQDEELAKQYKPITNEIQANNIELTNKIDKIANTLNKSIDISNIMLTLMDKLKTENVNVDLNVIKDLAPCLNATNSNFKLEHKNKDNFTFNDNPIKIRGNVLSYPNGTLTLTKNVRNLLASNKTNFNTLNEDEQNEALKFMHDFNLIATPDRKSTRARSTAKAYRLSVEAVGNSQAIEDIPEPEYPEDVEQGFETADDVEGSGIKTQDVTYVYKYFDSFKDLNDRFEILIGEKHAGNDNCKNEILEILDAMLNKNYITIEDYESALQNHL